eukprot:364232-Chlamydomonas_euryale.AAC.4
MYRPCLTHAPPHLPQGRLPAAARPDDDDADALLACQVQLPDLLQLLLRQVQAHRIGDLHRAARDGAVREGRRGWAAHTGVRRGSVDGERWACVVGQTQVNGGWEGAGRAAATGLVVVAVTALFGVQLAVVHLLLMLLEVVVAAPVVMAVVTDVQVPFSRFPALCLPPCAVVPSSLSHTCNKRALPHLLDRLLQLGQHVVGDGHAREEVVEQVAETARVTKRERGQLGGAHRTHNEAHLRRGVERRGVGSLRLTGLCAPQRQAATRGACC